jgi:hypothetical protein
MGRIFVLPDTADMRKAKLRVSHAPKICAVLHFAEKSVGRKSMMNILTYLLTELTNSISNLVVLDSVLINATNRLQPYRRGTDQAENTGLLFFRGADHVQNTSTVEWRRPHRKHFYCCMRVYNYVT